MFLFSLREDEEEEEGEEEEEVVMGTDVKLTFAFIQHKAQFSPK